MSTIWHTRNFVLDFLEIDPEDPYLIMGALGYNPEELDGKYVETFRSVSPDHLVV
jgi:hypothetical protein